ncbi:MAG: sulfatase-like hydrolase/transferase [Planctomycetaceae bacterium]|nr:sulfatase-like hydrolase/transferase [Planctomycetaceae bacterium]
MMPFPALTAALVLTGLVATAAAAAPRNIVLIYADDIGYGDVSCNGATAVQTPNVDRIARDGLRFTDGHSSSATCTPSRYALLTGEYPWRKKGTGVLPGDARLIVEPGRTTLASQLQRAGYKTGIVGKWHLGLGTADLNWNGEISPGPLDIGFDDTFSSPRPATACRACMSRTVAWSGSISATRFRSASGHGSATTPSAPSIPNCSK